MNSDTITLYPTNWLYNAGVVGLLNLLDVIGDDVQKYFSNGCINGNKLLIRINEIMVTEKCTKFPEPFNTIPLWHWHYVKEGFDLNYGGLRSFIKQNLLKASIGNNRSKIKDQLKIKKPIKFVEKEYDYNVWNQIVENTYSLAFSRNKKISIDDAENQILQELEREEIRKILFIYRKFVGSFFSKTTTGVYQNYFHNTKFDNLNNFINFFKPDEFLKLNSKSYKCDFCFNNKYEITPIKTDFMAFLFPNYNEYPNAFWNNDETKVTKICGICKFILIHHHFSLSHLSDGSQIFVNAPSFKVMYELNKLIKETYGTSGSEESKSKREILATSVIEYSRRITSTLGLWTEMNIEIVTRTKEGINFFSLPYEVIKIISDRNIAAILSDLGEFKILDKVLNQNFSELTEIAYVLLRESAKDFNNRNTDIINSLLYRWENKGNLTQTANKILKLYSLIENKIKRS